MGGRPETDNLASLEATDEFIARHVGPSQTDMEEMFEVLGVSDMEELMGQVVPDGIRFRELDEELAGPRSEYHVARDLRAFAHRNTIVRTCIGLGYYRNKVPAVIQRNVLENPAWYTAYTPYQPEISQGRLEALLNYQTMVADLCGTDMANASLLDEGTAAAEAMAMARRVTRSKLTKFFVDADTHPQTIEVIRTRAVPTGVEVVVGDPAELVEHAGEYFGCLLSYPGSSGAVPDFTPVVEAVHAAKGLVCVTTDLLALCLLTPPGEWGADVIVGSSQRFGVPMMFGGPHAAFMACHQDYARSMPGRIVGVSTDASGRPAARLALQTREQHIRREKATSNICTAQVLLAIMAGLYAAYHGPDGLRRIARRTAKWAGMMATALETGSRHKVINSTFFDTLCIKVDGSADEVLAAALARDVNLRKIDDTTVGVSFDEITDRSLFNDVLAAFGVELEDGELDALARRAKPGIPEGFAREGDILTHPVFNSYHSEHDMLRYLRRLADRDLALDRTMIPLGSCTMKLNATTEMLAVTMPEFAYMHPFCPIDQAEGYLALINQLRRFLVAVTGYADVSLQPNSGAQGEFAGLMAIRGYHLSRGDEQRDVCLIPQSAHGTNPASAAMAGMSVKVVKCNENGDVDLADLAAKIQQVGDRLAAIMITYPSTHGVFEVGVTKLCEMVHQAGGQVYVDGANMNALVGLARPGRFGGDVSHLNLHKTFAIPHGGGGPGVGPIGVAEHLQPFLPNHPMCPQAGPDTGVGPISAAPFGSAGVLSISWAYLRLMGGRGLTEATQAAILNANYIATRLSPYYRVLYTGDQGRVAHECILDLRDITKRSHVTVDDVAKRLIDFGFHAPTMSFPVAGTLMVEPTESEPKAELDRFCDAMIAIAGEIKQVEEGEWDIEDSPLRHAPHTAEDLITDNWDRKYGRELGAYPAGRKRADRYFPPVNRIDNVGGDRNLICNCPPIEAYQD